MSTPEETVRLSLDDTLTMLRRANTEIATETVKELRVIVSEVAEVAKRNAAEQGFTAPGKSGRGTGRLIEKIGYSMRGATGILRETAVSDAPYNRRDSSRHTYPGGYPYPAIFEFGRKAQWMNRPFLMPAVKGLAPEIIRREEAAVDRAIHRIQ